MENNRAIFIFLLLPFELKRKCQVKIFINQTRFTILFTIDCIHIINTKKKMTNNLVLYKLCCILHTILIPVTLN